MFAAASSLFARSALAANYTIHSDSPHGSLASSPVFGQSSSSSTAAAAAEPGPGVKPFQVGLWRVLRATNKTTQKLVSVWLFEKKALEQMERNVREVVLEALKREAASLSRLRHPCLLEMVEPLEETRAQLTFATEPLISSLAGTLKTARSGGVLEGVDLDEVEIQKGVLQVNRALSFLHTQAHLLHNNLSTEAILVNAKGDWKLGALNATLSLGSDGQNGARWEFPERKWGVPDSVQTDWDYMAPEYAIDEQVTAASDLYALGCIIYAVHLGGKPPFNNHQSLSSLRGNMDRLSRGEIGNAVAFARLTPDLKVLLSQLITRSPAGRLSSLTLPSHSFFSNLAISTLLFLDRSNFSSKTKEEKASFLRGLVGVLPKFSDRLRIRKILPSLVEEMKDPWLLPFILPCVFEIAKGQTKDEFNSVTLPALKPLFVLTDPPQNMLTLLESMPLFIEKSSPKVFRETIMSLVYNSLESEHAEVQEKALRVIPGLLDILDVSSVQEILFVKVAILFTKTRILSTKIGTLEVFRELVKVLDKTSLTQKLVPLLAKIKTKEADVMMATLSVHEAMGSKVDREAVANLVLPQLWSMSMGPLLSYEQFGRMMATIKMLGARVEEEHAQHLRERQRIQSQTASYSARPSGVDGAATVSNGEADFASLVAGAHGGASGAPAPAASVDPWDAPSWGSAPTPAFSPQPTSASAAASAAPSQPSSASTAASSSRLGARPVPASTFSSSSFIQAPLSPAPASSFPPPSSASLAQPSFALSPTATTPAARSAVASSFPTFGPPPSARPSALPPPLPTGPNYNITMPPAAPALRPAHASSPRPPQVLAPSAPPPRPAAAPPPGYSGGVLQPASTFSRPPPSATSNAGLEFDPFA